jgi:uncharacterized protein YciI
MLFLVYSLDKPATGKEIRRRTRAAHLQYVRDHKSAFVYGGALLGDSGEMIGTLAIIKAADRAALERFLKGDPYHIERLFEKVIINETRQTLPEAAPGFLDAEIATAAEQV